CGAMGGSRAVTPSMSISSCTKGLSPLPCSLDAAREPDRWSVLLLARCRFCARRCRTTEYVNAPTRCDGFEAGVSLASLGLSWGFGRGVPLALTVTHDGGVPPRARSARVGPGACDAQPRQLLHARGTSARPH